MALELHENIKDYFRSLIIPVFNSGVNTVELSIYKGTMPAGELASFTPATYSADLLITFDYIELGDDIQDRTDIDLITLREYPSRTGVHIGERRKAATATGTASWYVLRATDTGKAILGDVSDEAGTGSLKIKSTSLVSGQDVIISDFSIRIL